MKTISDNQKIRKYIYIYIVNFKIYSREVPRIYRDKNGVNLKQNTHRRYINHRMIVFDGKIILALALIIKLDEQQQR